MDTDQSVLTSFDEAVQFRKFIARYFDDYCKKKKNENSDSETVINILCIGALYIDHYLSDWLSEMAKKKGDFTIHLHIARDKNMIKQFPKQGYYPHSKILEEIKEYDNIDYSLIKIILEKDLELETEYDLIINLYQLHNAINWRLLTIRLFQHLKDGGIFLFSDVGGTFSILDGNFKNFPEEKAHGLKIFDEERNEKYHFWRPELSLTNYKVLKNQVEFLFDRIADSESAPETAEEWEKGVISGIKINKGYSFNKLITDQNFSYFRTGIYKTDAESIVSAEKTSELFKEDCSVLDRKDQLYMCISFNRQRFLNIKERHWNYAALLKDIDHIKDNSITSLGRKALDIFTSHDIFFPEFTELISIISWESEIAERWSYPIHQVIDKPYDKLVLERQTLMQIEPVVQFMKLIFKNSITKFPIYVSVLTQDDFENLTAKNYTVVSVSDQNDKIAFYIEKTRKDKIERVSILMDDNIFNKIGKLNKELLKKVVSGNWLPQTKESRLKTYGPVRCEIIDIKLQITDQEEAPIDNIKCYKLDTVNERITQLTDILESSLFDTSNQIAIPQNGTILEWLLTLSSVLHLRDAGTRVGFIPSAVIVNENENRKKSITGLGGVILYEKIPDLQDTILGGLFSARDKALEQAVNLIFYKSSIAENWNNSYTRALHSAGAAITARSGSHTLGSHVLPEIIGKLSDLIQNSDFKDPSKELGRLLNDQQRKILKDERSHPLTIFCRNMRSFQDNTRYLSNEKELFKYLQERLDYIAQIVGDHPQWSQSMNFASHLMKNFYQQTHILNSLGDTEGLGAYIYSPRKKFNGIRYQESDWLKTSPFEKDKHIILYGNCVAIKDDLVFVHTKEQAKMLLDGVEGIDKPPFQVFICSDRKGRNEIAQLREVLKSAYQEFGFYGRELEVSGQIGKCDGNIVPLNSCKISGNRLALKIRYRRYLYLNEDQQVIRHENFSEKLSEINDIVFDIGSRKINEHIEEFRNDRFEFFLGVIEAVGEPDERFNRKITLFSSDPYIFSFEVSDQICCKINDSDEVRKLKLKKEMFCVGARIILAGKKENGPNKDEFRITGNEGGQHPKICEISYIDYITSTSGIEQDDSSEFEDIKVAIPGGTVGTQAFYIILENIIRNAAKHNWLYLRQFYKKGKDLEVKIELEDRNNEDYYICKIWTNTTDLRYEHAIPFGGSFLKEFLNDKKSLNSQINQKLQEMIIEADGSLKRANLGLSEIKIGAAFLARYDWIKHGSLHGPGIIFDDKGANRSNGFIKCSMMLEEHEGKLVPRLGYRIKLLKPKDIVIIDYPEPLIEQQNKHVSFRDSKSNTSVDYQLFVLYTDASTSNFGNEVLKLIDDVLQGKIDDATLDLRIHDLSRRIENFPCRLFIVTEKKEQKDWAFLTDYGTSQIKNISKLNFFRYRIRFISPRSFKEKIKESFKNLEVMLYREWCSLFASTNFNYQLEIRAGTRNFYSSEIPSITVPRNLLPPGEESINKSVPDFKSLFIKREKAAQTLSIKYSRHDNRKTLTGDISDLYSEGLSGTSKVYSLLRNFSENDELLKAKLAENGLCNIMILDERIMKYVHSRDANKPTVEKNETLFGVFQHLNIIVPFKIEINKEVIYEAEIDKKVLKSVDGDIRTVELSELPDRKVIIYFKQPSNSSAENSYRVNSLVIHQTILDYFSKGLFYSHDSPVSDITNSDNVILRLKHTANIPCVIITSGRGRSPKSSRYAKFIPFSNISHLLLRKDPDKYTLTQVLLQSINIQG